MPRQPRLLEPNARYHVMNRGAAKQKIFRNRNDYTYFLCLLEEASVQYKIQVSAFCLMPNHYHLLVYTPEPNLNCAMKKISQEYTQYFNFCHKRDGAIFRGRYKSKLVEDENYFLTLIDYIHDNPVEAGICKNRSEYKWSSYNRMGSDPTTI